MLFLGASAASVATVATVNGISRIWPWMKAKFSPSSETVEVSVPEQKESDFKEMLEKGMLVSRLKQEMQNPNGYLEKELGNDVPEDEMNTLIKKMKDIHLSSLTECNNKDHVNVNEEIYGVSNVTEEYTMSVVAPANKPGTIINKRVNRDATHNVHKKGGIEVVGGSTELINSLAEKHTDVQKHKMEVDAANKFKVSVMFSDGSKKYKGESERDDTLYDVKCEIEQTGKKVKHFKYFNSNEDSPLPLTTEISSLHQEGQLGNLEAVLQEDK